MSLDLTKQLKMAKVEDIDKRFASSDEIMETYTTALATNQTNSFTFQDTAQVVKPIPPSQDANENTLTDKSISPANKAIMTKTLGYEPKNNNDITKAIDKISVDLKEASNVSMSWLTDYTNSDNFKVITFTAAKYNYTDNNNTNNTRSNKNNNSINNINSISNNEDKFGTLYKKNDKAENDLQNNLNNIAPLSTSYLDDKDVSEALASSEDINFLEKMNAKGYETFIADNVSAEYLSTNEDSNILNEMKSTMSSTLKYATSTCKDLVDVLNTMITDMADLIKGIIKFLSSAINCGSVFFLSDILKCFDKTKDVIFKPDNAQAIGKQIEQKGNLGTLKVLLDQNKPDKFNYKKLLYNTTKNSPNTDNSIFDSIKTDFDIDDSEDFMAFKKPKLLTNENNLFNDITEPIFDINKTKTNPTMANIILSQYDEDNSKNSDFLKSIPLLSI